VDTALPGRIKKGFEPERLTRFAQTFRQTDFKSGGWSVRAAGGLPRLEYNAAVLEFVSQVRGCGCAPEGFRWISWQKECARFRDDPALADSASLEDCRKLLVTVVELDCHRDGFLGEMIQSGLIARVLERIKELSAGLSAG